MKSICFGLLALVLVLLMPMGAAAATFEVATGATTKTVKANEEHTNKDGVTVKNDKGSKGDIKITPKDGVPNNPDPETRVTFKNGAKGECTGLDSNDTVDVGPNCAVDISGDGGTITAAGGSNLTVSNTSDTESIVVNTPSGGHTIIPPGQTATVLT